MNNLSTVTSLYKTETTSLLSAMQHFPQNTLVPGILTEIHTFPRILIVGQSLKEHNNNNYCRLVGLGGGWRV